MWSWRIVWVCLSELAYYDHAVMSIAVLTLGITTDVVLLLNYAPVPE